MKLKFNLSVYDDLLWLHTLQIAMRSEVYYGKRYLWIVFNYN